MAKNDIVLLDSLVERSKARFGEQHNASEIFELFCFEQLLKDIDPSYEELEAGWTDGPEDGGIDGFYVFVDGRFATRDVLDYASRRDPAIRLVICTVRRTDTFQQEPLNALAISLAELLDLRKADSELTYPFAEAVLDQRRLFREVFVALADRRPTLAIEVYYCSRGDTSTLADNLLSRATQLRDSLALLFSAAQSSVEFKGATELLELARRQPTYSLRLKFTESYISREGRNYIVLTTLPDYFDFITDERGELRRYLFESNVRDYLGEVQINQDIRRSLQRKIQPDVEDFWWLNNGVTILATHATVIGKELHLENVQIVNGLQTTETVYQHFKTEPDRDDHRAILLKIVLTSDEQTRARIIKATNYQNTVDLGSLRGLDRIQQDIDHFLADHGWFYDRRKNYYKNQGRPADRIVSIAYLAAAVRAIALGDPVRSQRQRSRSLREESVYSQVFNPRWDLNVYMASVEITRAIETILQTRKTVYETPPISLVHFIAYIFTCAKLGKHRYRPDEVAKLAGKPPQESDVLTIRDELRQAAEQIDASGLRVFGIALNRDFVNQFVKARFGRGQPPQVATAAANLIEHTTAGEMEVSLAVLGPDVEAALADVHKASTPTEQVAASYRVLQTAAHELVGGVAGRVPFNKTLRAAAFANGTSSKELAAALRPVFSLRGRVRNEGYTPSELEAETYLKRVLRVLSMVGYKRLPEHSSLATDKRVTTRADSEGND
jgi:hypothetical protein